MTPPRRTALEVPVKPRPPRPPLALPLLLALAGCSGTESGSPAAEGAPIWEAELLHEIGSIDDPEQTLTRVGEVVLTETGEMLIGQPADMLIRVHDSDGALLNSIGRRGEGPGEVGSLADFAVRGDTVTVVDGGNSRVTRFAIDGALLDDEPWELVVVRGDRVGYMYRIGASPLQDGSSVSVPSVAAAAMVRGGGATVEIRPVVRRIDADGTLGDTVMVTDQAEHVRIPEDRGSVISMHPLMMEDRQGTGVVRVLRSPDGSPDAGTFRVIRVDAAGDTVFDRGFGFEPIPVPPDTLAAYLAEAPEELRERLEARMWAPDDRPPVEALALGSDGTIWLQREPVSDLVDWWALGPGSGEHLGTLRVPLGSRVVESRGDEVVVVRTDEFDVEYVQRWRLRR